MAKAFESARGSLAGRLLAALKAGDSKGGDARGIESAALFVAHRERWFPAIWSDHWVNFRVDQHRKPIAELGRLVHRDEVETRRFLARRAAAARKRKRRVR
jgi:uncharacterized Ntn-hydrolase superfamily protein